MNQDKPETLLCIQGDSSMKTIRDVIEQQKDPAGIEGKPMRCITILGARLRYDGKIKIEIEKGKDGEDTEQKQNRMHIHRQRRGENFVILLCDA